MAKLVRDAMTPYPRTIGSDAAIVDAARVLEEENIGALPVIDSGYKLRGILTDRDIAIRVVAAGLDPSTTLVSQVASNEVGWVYPDEPLDEAVELMAYRRVRRLPVIDEDERLVGILAQADVVHEVKDKQAGKLVEEISQPTQTVAV